MVCYFNINTCFKNQIHYGIVYPFKWIFVEDDVTTVKVPRGSVLYIDCNANVEPKWNFTKDMPPNVQIIKKFKNNRYTSQLRVLSAIEENNGVYICSQEEELEIRVEGIIKIEV